MPDARFSLLYFCESLYTLQRGLAAIADLLVNYFKSQKNYLFKIISRRKLLRDCHYSVSH